MAAAVRWINRGTPCHTGKVGRPPESRRDNTDTSGQTPPRPSGSSTATRTVWWAGSARSVYAPGYVGAEQPSATGLPSAFGGQGTVVSARG